MDQSVSSKIEPTQNAAQSPTFGKDGSFHVDEAVGSASISPSGRDVVLASRQGLHIIDLDNPFSPPRHLPHRTPWEVADVQWSPFASRDYWVVSTSNQKALVWNLDMATNQAPIQYVLHAHSRAISDINFSAHHPDKLATCAIDSFVHCWDFRQPSRPVISFADWFAGATQVKWNRQDPHIIASSHDRYLHIWDERKAVVPLKTINAHATKIYGIDWNRTDANSILTCSLDRTIKFWDYSRSEDTPTNIITTTYPIWRARHTPFGCGVLAMPQRGSNDLHLYDWRLVQGNQESNQVAAQPIHSFTGHQDQVKEFLWRAQGSVDDGIDNRAFQLVSWSTDRNLLLHRLDEGLYDKVGYARGAEANASITFTRKGASYRSFHNESAPQPPQAIAHGLSALFGNKSTFGMKRVSIPTIGWDGRHSTSASGSGMRVRNTAQSRETNPIEWMKGVKIGDSRNLRDSGHLLTAQPWEKPESLGDEITVVGDKYRNVTFEKVEVSSRFVVLSLSGPWGVDETVVYVKSTIRFPSSYPHSSAANVEIERTSNISDASFTRINVEIKVVCEAYVSIERGSLEAILRYLLGEDDLQQSLVRVNELRNSIKRAIDSQDEESSSDEEDAVLGSALHAAPTIDMEGSTGELIGNVSANANVPLPKACGALWADDGRLICFFPPKDNNRATSQLFSSNDSERRPRSGHLFESFGQLPLGDWIENEENSVEDFDTSSISSTSFSLSSTDSETYDLTAPLKDLWPNSSRPFMDSSSEDHRLAGIKSPPPRRPRENRQFISLHDFSDLLPSKRILAEEYHIYGDGRDVCDHNASVAINHGSDDLAGVWTLLGMILCDEVPLEALGQLNGEPELLVLARRALVNIKKRDSGLDLAFDEPESVRNPKVKGRVKWGNHPLAGMWMIDKIFEHFERIADVQMVAMLSCILCETEKHRSNTRQQHPASIPLTLSPEYFPTPAVALSYLLPRSSTSAHSKLYPPFPATFGSFPSSSGVWLNDGNEAGKKDSNSEASSPLTMSRQNSRTFHFERQGLSSSPERTVHRSNSVASQAFGASFSRQFASFMTSASSSPPYQSRTPELSTSAPTSGGVTWGKKSTYKSGSNQGRSESTHGAAYDLVNASVVDDDDEAGDEETTIVLKNQDMIDDEACLSLPLLRPEHEALYRAYREAYAHLLYVWDLPLTRSEILKFNFYSFPHDSEIQDVAPEENDVHFVAEDTEALNMVPSCPSCGDESTATISRQKRCQKCQAASAGLPCSLCGESVRGLYRSCLICGHVTHLGCVVTVQSDPEGTGHNECNIGCGCLCDEVLEQPMDSTQAISNVDLRARVREELGVKEWSKAVAVSD